MLIKTLQEFIVATILEMFIIFGFVYFRFRCIVPALSKQGGQIMPTIYIHVYRDVQSPNQLLKPFRQANFLVIAKFFINAKLFTIYQVNWQLGGKKWLTIARLLIGPVALWKEQYVIDRKSCKQHFNMYAATSEHNSFTIQILSI